MARGGGSFFAGFLLGGILGAFVGLVMAPQRGEETRAQILERGAGLGPLPERIEELKVRVDDLASRVRGLSDEAVARSREVLKEALEEGRQAAAQTASELQARFKKEKEKAGGA